MNLKYFINIDIIKKLSNFSKILIIILISEFYIFCNEIPCNIDKKLNYESILLEVENKIINEKKIFIEKFNNLSNYLIAHNKKYTGMSSIVSHFKDDNYLKTFEKNNKFWKNYSKRDENSKNIIDKLISIKKNKIQIDDLIIKDSVNLISELKRTIGISYTNDIDNYYSDIYSYDETDFLKSYKNYKTNILSINEINDNLKNSDKYIELLDFKNSLTELKQIDNKLLTDSLHKRIDEIKELINIINIIELKCDKFNEIKFNNNQIINDLKYLNDIDEKIRIYLYIDDLTIKNKCLSKYKTITDPIENTIKIFNDFIENIKFPIYKNIINSNKTSSMSINELSEINFEINKKLNNLIQINKIIEKLIICKNEYNDLILEKINIEKLNKILNYNINNIIDNYNKDSKIIKNIVKIKYLNDYENKINKLQISLKNESEEYLGASINITQKIDDGQYIGYFIGDYLNNSIPILLNTEKDFSRTGRYSGYFRKIGKDTLIMKNGFEKKCIVFEEISKNIYFKNKEEYQNKKKILENLEKNKNEIEIKFSIDNNTIDE